jgi:hypothetical protein
VSGDHVGRRNALVLTGRRDKNKGRGTVGNRRGKNGSESSSTNKKRGVYRSRETEKCGEYSPRDAIKIKGGGLPGTEEGRVVESEREFVDK